MPLSKNIVILIAEDDDGHFLLTQHCLRQGGITNKVIRFSDGLETVQFFSNHKDDSQYDPDTTYLLVLDIRMPKIDGIEVLEQFKNDQKLSKIPVIMLSTSDAPHQIELCYKLGCDAYSIKPVGDAFIKTVLKVCSQRCLA